MVTMCEKSKWSIPHSFRPLDGHGKWKVSEKAVLFFGILVSGLLSTKFGLRVEMSEGAQHCSELGVPSECGVRTRT